MDSTLSVAAAVTAAGPAILLAVADPVGTSIAVAVCATVVNGAITALNLWISHREKEDDREKKAYRELNAAQEKQLASQAAEVRRLEEREEVLTAVRDQVARQRDRLLDHNDYLAGLLQERGIKFRPLPPFPSGEHDALPKEKAE